MNAAEPRLSREFAKLLSELGAALATLSDDDRVALMEIAFKDYCRNCGRKLDPPPFDTCHCENDE